MISVIVLIRNARQLAFECIQSIRLSMTALQFGGEGLEYILIDDCSDEAAQIPAMLHVFRAQAGAQVRIIRLRRHSHYAYGLALGMSLAHGENIFFFSHDMVVPPACVQTMLEIAAMKGDAAAIIRPRSQHMDGADEMKLAPSSPLRTLDDVSAFSRWVRQCEGAAATGFYMLIGDAMLIQRRVIDRIGVFDSRFFGFMADIDYGVRAQRAGFEVVTAHGAWLHHVGAGFTKDAQLRGGDWNSISARERAEVAAAYDAFRKKWRPAALPADFTSITLDEFTQLLKLPPGAFDAFQPPLPLDPDRCELL